MLRTLQQQYDLDLTEDQILIHIFLQTFFVLKVCQG